MTPENEHMEQVPVTFKCPEALAELLRKAAFDLDKSASEIIRSCILLALPQVRTLRGLDRVCLEDIRSGEGRNKNNVGRE